MPLDSNKFDTWLKDKPLRDLVFRAFIWSVLSCIAIAYAIKRGLTPVAYVERLAESIGPLVNSVGLFALAVGLAALCFKDLEFLDPTRYGQDSTLGKFGGVVRRVGGDLMLWMLGAFISLLSATVVAIVLTGVSSSEVPQVSSLVYLLLFVCCGVTVLTYFIRRASPSPAIEMLKKPLILFSAYAVMVCGAVVYLILHAA